MVLYRTNCSQGFCFANDIVACFRRNHQNRNIFYSRTVSFLPEKRNAIHIGHLMSLRTRSTSLLCKISRASKPSAGFYILSKSIPAWRSERPIIFLMVLESSTSSTFFPITFSCMNCRSLLSHAQSSTKYAGWHLTP